MCILADTRNDFAIHRGSLPTGILGMRGEFAFKIFIENEYHITFGHTRREPGAESYPLSIPACGREILVRQTNEIVKI